MIKNLNPLDKVLKRKFQLQNDLQSVCNVTAKNLFLAFL